MNKLIAIALAAAFAVPTLALAGDTLDDNRDLEDTAAYRMKACETSLNIAGGQHRYRSPSEVLDAGVCIGLLKAALWYLPLVATAMEASDGKPFCLPDFGVSAKQLYLVVQKYLRDHPETLHKHFAEVIVLAVKAGFPCR